MRIRLTSSWIIVTLAALLLIVAGCERESDVTNPATSPDDADVFLDEFGDNVTFQAFAGSKLDALDTDASVVHSGTQSLIITVPDEGNAAGTFAGGAFTTSIARDLSGYDAVTFWAKASTPATLNVVGLGNDNTGTSLYMAEMYNLELTTSWTKFIVPIPLPEKLEAEQGLFYFAEGPEDGQGYQFWIDDLQFEAIELNTPQPDIGTETVEAEIGEEIVVDMATVTYNIGGNDYILWAQQNYFSFASSNTNAVEVAEDGTITAVGLGTATITAELGSVDADGQITVTVGEGPDLPGEPAPTPTQDAGDVISIFSNAYTNASVDSWSADWDVAEYADLQIDGDDVKQYTDLVYAGIDFSSVPINASGMTHFYMNLWTPVTVDASTQFKIKLVDFGADGVYQGGDDVESELTFTTTSSPALVSGSWIKFDIPLVNFSGLATTEHVAQLIISGGNLPTVYVDNIFFYDSGQIITDPEPTTPAPTPTHDAGDVISLFSNAYDDVTVDTWSADWDEAELEDVQIAGNDTKKYTGLTVAGIEFTSETIDASEMTYFHMDFWTPDATSDPAAFKIKLVDFGADGAWGGDDDVEHELTFTANTDPALETTNWVSFDIPLQDFAGLTTTGHLAQLILSGDPNTVYIDNVYFHGGEVIPDPEPTEAAPAPTYPAANVISLFCDEYTNVPVSTWSAEWDEAFFEDVQIAGNDTKKYSISVYAGIEFLDPTIDASGMTHFRMDIWTPDDTADPAIFKIKLVDFGANGVWSGGDDVEHELTYTASTTPGLVTGSWITFDIPLSEFTGLVTSEHMAQLVISGDLSTVYVDNVLFHN